MIKEIKKTIKLNNKPIADFYYRETDKTIGEATKSFVQNYKKLISFFGVQPPKISIYFIYDRKKMDKHWGEKTGKWLVAMVDSKSIYVVYIFSPLVFEKLTSHKRDKIIPIITHETAHTFVSQINKRCFYWTNEGVCQFVENWKLDNKIDKKHWNWFRKNKILIDADISWPKVIDHQGYKISYHLVDYIIKKYGKEAVIKLLKIRRDSNDKNLEKKMAKILGGDLDKFLDDFEKGLKLISQNCAY